MLVKDVVALATQNLGRDDLADALSKLKNTPTGELASLLRCYNLVENEVALDYFPLKREEKLKPVGGVLAFSRFQSAPLDIYKVTGADGAPLPYTLTPTGIVLPAGAGEATVLYSYSPEKKAYGDTVPFTGRVTDRLLAFGVASEFCITNRQYREGAMWGKRYRDALDAAGIYRRTLAVPSRRWV